MRPKRCRSAAREHGNAVGRPTFLTLHGITTFLTGAFMAGVALMVALVQVVARLQDSGLAPFLPAALTATAAAFVAGLWLLLAAEFAWVSGESLDVAAPSLCAGAMGWMVRNRMGTARKRRGGARARRRDERGSAGPFVPLVAEGARGTRTRSC